MVLLGIASAITCNSSGAWTPARCASCNGPLTWESGSCAWQGSFTVLQDVFTVQWRWFVR